MSPLFCSTSNGTFAKPSPGKSDEIVWRSTEGFTPNVCISSEPHFFALSVNWSFVSWLGFVKELQEIGISNAIVVVCGPRPWIASEIWGDVLNG